MWFVSLYVPLTVQGLQVRALLDSGASDNLVSEKLADHIKLPRYPLPKALNVQLANGVSVPISSMVRIYLNIAGLKIWLLLEIVQTPFLLVLGYAFLSYLNHIINWKN